MVSKFVNKIVVTAAMNKIVALNNSEGRNSDDEENIVTWEAQESIAETEYIRAMKLKSDGHINLCLNLLNELLKTQLLNENMKNDSSVKLWIIKYNCHKNIALILEERFDYMLALQHYISAIIIDCSDVSTLYRFGQISLKLHANDLAEYAFENCLSRNPAHWCAAEGMLQVMNKNHNVIGLYICARKICSQNMNYVCATNALKEVTCSFNQHFPFLRECSDFDCNQFYNELYIKQPRYFVYEDSSVKCAEVGFFDKIPDLKKFCIKESNWHSIGQFITKVYAYLREIEHNMLFVFNFDDIIHKSSYAALLDIKKDVSDVNSTVVDNIQQFALKSGCVFEHDKRGVHFTAGPTAKKPEIQHMDYSNYDSDSNLKKDGYEVNKTKPRRRCSDLHYLEQWGWHKSRRYSSRKKNERDEVDTSLNGYLRRILKKYTKTPIEDKWPFSKTPGIHTNADKEFCECKMNISEDSFNLKTQKEFDIFIKKLQRNDVDLMQVTYKWLKYFSLAWSLSIPEKYKILYIDIFKIYMSHFNFSTWNQLSPTNYEASYRICILYLELSAKNHINDSSDLWRSVFYQLIFNIGNCHITSAKKFEIYQLKLIYMEFLLLNKEYRYEDCLSCLKKMLEILEQEGTFYVLHLPNLDNECVNISFLRSLQFKYERQIDVNNIPKYYKNGSWEKLSNIITVNIESSESKYDDDYWFKDIFVQIEILLQSFWIMASYENCLIWSEKCFQFAVSHYLQESKTSHRCTLLEQLINYTTSYIEAIILNEGFHFVVSLNKENLCRMVQNINRILVYQFDGTFEKNSNHGRQLNFKRLWVILHQLVLREETNNPITLHTKNGENQDVKALIPNSFLILFTAHEYLGKRQWCTDDNGEFLQYILDAVVRNFKAPIYDDCRDIIYEHLEQVTYCLFKYPQRKGRLRYLEDHEASQMELSWPRATQLFELYRPENLPEFNSYKLESITSDMEQLILKIILLMPKELDPSKLVEHVTMFIQGQLQSLPSESETLKLPYNLLCLYYLLADFYFKNRDFIKAIKFYTLDIIINPTRFDSWAGMALSKASKIETKLNALDPISMENIWEECEEVLRCFECCINLNRYQTLLWIEYGSFSYTIHSWYSRYAKYNSKNMSSETFSVINERKIKMLTIAYNCFSLANSLQNSAVIGSGNNSDNNDEKWLCQYMLGKISEKRREEPKVQLNHYLMAANYLYENNATYPIKINHSNPTLLSVEALEVFYRINTVIIKYLHREKQISRCTGDLFNKVLKSLSSSPFAYNKAKIDDNSLNLLQGKACGNINSSGDYVVKCDYPSFQNRISLNLEHEQFESKKCNEKLAMQEAKDHIFASTSNSARRDGSTSGTSTMESGSDSDESLADCEKYSNTKNANYSVEELKVIYKMVVQNIEECATRFPEHYKSIYRLTYYYMNSPAADYDLTLSEQLLFGQYKTNLGNLINGLFHDRKTNNLFNGIWRIPSSEIDRPGSFSAHLVKCVKIFIQLLFETKNHIILVDLAMNLYKTPDFDKKYITDVERKLLCQQSINCSIQILRSNLQKTLDNPDDKDTLNLLIDIYKIYKKCAKYMNQMEPMYAELLVDAYKFFIGDKVEYVPDNNSLLDLAIKLCMQKIVARKNVEKSLCTDSIMNISECITTQSTEIIKMDPKMQPVFRENLMKPSATVSNLSMYNTLNLLSDDFTKNSKLLANFGNSNQLPGKDSPELTKLFEELYSKILNKNLNICSAVGLVPQKSINYIKNETNSNNLNNSNLIAAESTATITTSEISNHEVLSNMNDTLLQNEFYSTVSKQHLKTKTSHKTKSIIKPYNRPVYIESSQNQKVSFNNYKINILSNQVNISPSYCNLLHHTTTPQTDNNKYMMTTQKLPKEEVPQTSTNSRVNVAIKDFHNNVNSLKFTMPQTSTLHFPSTTQMGNPVSDQQYTDSSNDVTQTKTLQEKLAERQKAYKLIECNSASTFTCAKEGSCDDIIVLD